MSKKKNNRSNRGNNTTPLQKAVANLASGQIEKIDKFVAEEMPKEAEAIPEDQLVETKEDESKAADVRKSGNVEHYLDFLRSKLARIKAIENKAEGLKARYETDLNDLALKKSEFEKDKKASENELNNQRNALNKRDKELKEERLAMDNGEYSSVIQSLLNQLSATEEEITQSTKTLVEEMGRRHTSYISALSELAAKKDEIEGKMMEIDSAKAELERKHKMDEMSRTSYEKRIKQEMEDDYHDKINTLEDENFSLKRKNAQLDKDIKKAEEFKRQLMSCFNSTDVENMLKEQIQLKDKCHSLEKEMEERHTNAEYEEKAQAVEDLKSKVRELEEKVSEERLGELRLSLHNADAYIIEINTCKAKLDSAEAREKSLLSTVKDLRETINQLKDEEKVKEAAFGQARRMDTDTDLQDGTFRRLQPDSLKQLVEYLQIKMAAVKDPEPFYYEQKTIRTFLAGLNMSPLSILQGISGTGKTSLPREIAKALVAGDERYTGKNKAGNRNEPYRICAIQSGWRDNMDLMGFYNNFEKKYKETDFFKAVYLAAQPKYKDTLFLIILDEMNLSHPEHYFADFLSMMEQSVSDRYVKIHADEGLLPRLFVGRQMQLPENVRFIGTANHDETTLDFAPKTYDRSNVMVMSTNDAQKVKQEIQASSRGYSGNDRYSVSYSWLKNQFADAEELYGRRYLEFNKFIKDSKFIENLRQRGIGVGNRFDKQAKKFI